MHGVVGYFLCGFRLVSDREGDFCTCMCGYVATSCQDLQDLFTTMDEACLWVTSSSCHRRREGV